MQKLLAYLLLASLTNKLLLAFRPPFSFAFQGHTSQDTDLGEEEEDLNIPKVIGVSTYSSTYSRSAEINSEIDYKELKYQLFAVAYRGTNTEHFLALFNLLWHPALYEHPVLPFRYKREGPRFCSGMVEQDVRTRQDATLPSGIFEYHGMIAEGALRLIKNDRSGAFTPSYINARDSLYKAKIIWYIR